MVADLANVNKEESIRPLSHGRLVAMSVYWAASNFMWGALFLVIIPAQAKIMAPGSYAKLAGFLIGMGAIPALLIPLVVGVLSDRCMSPIGRRRPFIFAGTMLVLVSLALMYMAGNVSWIAGYIGAYLLLQVGSNTAMAAFSGVIPDLVHKSQRGQASGYMAIMSQFGILLGVVCTGQLVSSSHYLLSFGLIILANVIGLAITMKWVVERRLEEQPPSMSIGQHFTHLLSPLKHRDFMWVWLTRAFVMLGFYGLMPFIQYFIGDVIAAKHPAKAASMVSAVVLVATVMSGYFGGMLSDKIGRKRIVYFANGFMAVICLAFAFATNLPIVFVLGALFGLGYGAYISVDWALGTDVLPSKDDAAKDLAVWHISMTLPQAIASFPAALLISAFGMRETLKVLDNGLTEKVPHYTQPGYAALFLAAGLCILLGAVLLKNVKGAR